MEYPRCKRCEREIGHGCIFVRRTSQDAYVSYENVVGLIWNRISKQWILDIEEIILPVEPEVTYLCDYCNTEYTQKEVFDLMEQVEKVREEEEQNG